MTPSPQAAEVDRGTLLRMARDKKSPPELLTELARQHVEDLEICLMIVENPAANDEALVYLARHAHPAVLQTIIEETNLLERVTGIRGELAAPAEGDIGTGEGEGQDQAPAPGRQRQKALNESVRGLNTAQKMILAVRGSRAVRLLLIRDANETVALETLFSPKMTETDILAVAQLRDVSEKVLRSIAEDRRYKANRSIAWALLNNPKTPVAVSLTVGLNNLTDKELASLARNKNIPAALARAARGLIDKRAEKGKPRAH